MMICPACGKQLSRTVEQYHYRESGLNNVIVSGVGIFRCACGQEYVQLPGAQKVHDQVALALLNKPSLLTGQESKFLRKWLRLTSEEMASALGYTRVTVSRWENEGPSVKTDRAIRLYASAVRNIATDFENLFSSMSSKPQKHFKILVDGERAALQYSNVPGEALDIRSEPKLEVAQTTTTACAPSLGTPPILGYVVTGVPLHLAPKPSSAIKFDLGTGLNTPPILGYVVTGVPLHLAPKRPNEDNNDLALAA